MATVRLWRDDEVGKDPAVKAVFDDIRRVRGSDFVNNFHSHTAAAKQKGMTEAQHMHLLAIIGMASETNNLVNAMQVPVDREFLVDK